MIFYYKDEITFYKETAGTIDQNHLDELMVKMVAQWKRFKMFRGQILALASQIGVDPELHLDLPEVPQDALEAFNAAEKQCKQR